MTATLDRSMIVAAQPARERAAAEAPVRELHHGDQVEILKGGHRGDFARVRSLYNDYLSLTTDSGIILSGFHKNDVRKLARMALGVAA